MFSTDTVPGAFHNSYERFDPPKCHPQTRRVELWAENRNNSARLIPISYQLAQTLPALKPFIQPEVDADVSIFSCSLQDPRSFDLCSERAPRKNSQNPYHVHGHN